MDSLNFIIWYTFCVFIVTNLLCVWFETSFPLHTIGLLLLPPKTCDLASFQELMDKVDEKSHFLGDLLSCQICFGTWISFAVSTCLVFLPTYLPLYFIPVCVFSVPALATGLKKSIL